MISSCLADSDLSETTGSVFTSEDAKDALKTAASGSYPTGADIKLLPEPYNNTYCTDDAEVTIKPQEYNVFCNGDGSVMVRTQGKPALLLYFTMNILH